jgi:hypothetical protein
MHKEYNGIKANKVNNVAVLLHAMTGIGYGLVLWEYTPDKLKSKKYEKIFKAAGKVLRNLKRLF